MGKHDHFRQKASKYITKLMITLLSITSIYETGLKLVEHGDNKEELLVDPWDR